MNTNCTNQYNWLYLRFLFPILMALIGSSMAAYGQDGTQKWAFPTGGFVGSPAIGADGTVYVGSFELLNNLYAINPDGTQKWVFRTGGAVNASPAIGADGTLYVGSGDGNLYAINGSSGGLSPDAPWPKFSHDVKNTGRVPQGPNTVLVANFMNGNTDFFRSRIYLWNPSVSPGSVSVRVFTLEQTGFSTLLGMVNLGSLGSRSALNLRLEDILDDLLIPRPYETDAGNLTLEFTIGAADVIGAAQVFDNSQSLAFGTYPLQRIE